MLSVIGTFTSLKVVGLKAVCQFTRFRLVTEIGMSSWEDLS